MKACIALWLVLLTTPWARGAEPQGSLRLSGAWALYPMAVRWAEEFQNSYPDIHISVSAGGTGKGMSDVLAGRVDISMCSREVAPLEAARGAVAITVCKDAVVAVINARNPVWQDLQRKGVGKETLAALWLRGEVQTWGAVAGTAREAPLHIYTRSDACGAAETWANYLGGTQAGLKGARVFGDPGIRDAVRRDPLALGYNNVNYAYDPRTGKPAAGLTILPLDVNGNGVLEKEEDFYRTREELVAAIRRGDYPSPPARDLYFVVKGSPTNEPLRAFLRWVLTDGQKFVPESGYLHPPAKQRRAGLEALGFPASASGQ